VHFDTSDLHVARAKSGKPATHPLTGAELRALRQLKRDWPEGRYLFTNERGSPMTPTGFAKMLARASLEAGFLYSVHPHMLRHAAGYFLINSDVDVRIVQTFLGHKSISTTAHYTALAPGRLAAVRVR